MAIDTVGIHHRRIDRRGFDHGSFRTQVADRKTDRAGETASPSRLRGHDHVIRLNPVPLPQHAAQLLPARTGLPPVQHFAERTSGGGQHIQIEQIQVSQVEHDFRDAAGQEDTYRGVILRSIGQDIDQPRHAAIDCRSSPGPSVAGARPRKRWPVHGAADSSIRHTPHAPPSRCGSRPESGSSRRSVRNGRVAPTRAHSAGRPPTRSAVRSAPTPSGAAPVPTLHRPLAMWRPCP